MANLGEGAPDADIKSAIQRLRELVALNHDVLLPEVVVGGPRREWQGDPSMLAVFDDDKKYPVRGEV